MAEGSGERSWWQTLPGMLTARGNPDHRRNGAHRGAAPVVSRRRLRYPDVDCDVGLGEGDGDGASTTAGDTLEACGTPVHVRVTMPSGRTARLGDSRYDVVGARASAGNPGS